jgi:acylphosphatase
MIALRVVVSGRVQGVGYRYSMIEAAEMLGVVGWVRNRRDGAVEAFVQGDAEAVRRIVEWCRRGPPSARVTEIATTPVAVDASIAGFVQRHTE